MTLRVGELLSWCLQGEWTNKASGAMKGLEQRRVNGVSKVLSKEMISLGRDNIE